MAVIQLQRLWLLMKMLLCWLVRPVRVNLAQVPVRPQVLHHRIRQALARLRQVLHPVLQVRVLRVPVLLALVRPVQAVALILAQVHRHQAVHRIRQVRVQIHPALRVPVVRQIVHRHRRVRRIPVVAVRRLNHLVLVKVPAPVRHHKGD